LNAPEYSCTIQNLNPKNYEMQADVIYLCIFVTQSRNNANTTGRKEQKLFVSDENIKTSRTSGLGNWSKLTYWNDHNL